LSMAAHPRTVFADVVRLKIHMSGIGRFSQ
jgi:hypothetical protein